MRVLPLCSVRENMCLSSDLGLGDLSVDLDVCGWKEGSTLGWLARRWQMLTSIDSTAVCR
jgi:hypothetical protein